MAPGPDEQLWPGGGSEPPRVTACRRDGPPPHTHIWTVSRRPGGSLEVEVCIRCHTVKWEHLDAQIRVFADKLTKKITQKLVEMFTAEEPPRDPPEPPGLIDVPLPGL